MRFVRLSPAGTIRCAKELRMLSRLALQSSDNVLGRIRAEYAEMPGLKLTAAQAQRLWGLDRESCDGLMAGLVTSGFLARTRDGAFVRCDPSFVR
jgi:hypothetical protein